jgi:phage terminase large subunit
MFEMAKGSDEWFAEKLTASDTGVFSEETLRNELAELISERGEEDGEAIYQQEYMTSFSAGLPGAYYAKIIDKTGAGLGRSPPFRTIPSGPVHTAWDWAATTPRQSGSFRSTARAGR